MAEEIKTPQCKKIHTFLNVYEGVQPRSTLLVYRYSYADSDSLYQTQWVGLRILVSVDVMHVSLMPWCVVDNQCIFSVSALGVP